MPKSAASSNKAKIARRVIEVLEYFDDSHPEATVMDIVRRYNRPQSSTSELLSSLVELGLLHKDPYSRSYRLTARAALLGTAAQEDIVRDGRLIRLMDRLVSQTGLSVALFGMVGLKAQIVSWRSGPRAAGVSASSLYGGMQAPLSDSAAGWLLLSTIPHPRCEGMIRHLNADAADDRKFSFGEMTERVQACRDAGHGHGAAGFGSTAEVLAVLLPDQAQDHPLAIGFVYGRDDNVNTESLLQCLNEAMQQVLAGQTAEAARVQQLANAA